MNWPYLFKALSIGPLFEEFPLVDEKDSLFSCIVSSLETGEDKEFLIQLYDQVFVECLTLVQTMPEVDPFYLLSKIKEKRQSDELLSYQERLEKEPYLARHDLVLYLAWDRVCVYLAVLFERSYRQKAALEGLQVLKDCLVESFLHINSLGKTKPGFFRMAEALFAYYLREELIDTHSEEEWDVFCKSTSILRPRDQWIDVPYVDECIMTTRQEPGSYESQDSLDVIELSQKFAKCMIEKLQKEYPEWNCQLIFEEIKASTVTF
jgi:hypothetical protein